MTRITTIAAKGSPRAMTPDTALRRSRYFGTTPELWLNLQLAYDLSAAVIHRGADIDQVVRPRAA